MAIFLVRHGEDTDNALGVLNGRKDTDLTPLGRAQAEALAETLLSETIHAIYSSPLRRTRETASIIARRLGRAEIFFHEDLVEREYGLLTGRPYADIPLLASGFIQNGAVRNFVGAEGAESFEELLARAGRMLQEIGTRHAKENVLLVTHRYIGQAIRAVFHGHTLEQEFETNYFKNGEVVRLL